MVENGGAIVSPPPSCCLLYIYLVQSYAKVYQAIIFYFFLWNIRHIEVFVTIFEGNESTHVIVETLFIAT